MGQISVDEISEILDKYDPINIVGPTGEYLIEAKAIFEKKEQWGSQEELLSIIYQVFVEWFGSQTAGGIEQYEQIAAEIWAIFTSHRSSP